MILKDIIFSMSFAPSGRKDEYTDTSQETKKRIKENFANRGESTMEDRKTFEIPDGWVAEKDAEGRATGRSWPVNRDPNENKPFGRQPMPITVTIEGERPDVLAKWHEMHKWLDGRFANVDFDYREMPGSNPERKIVTFRCYPFAVND